MVSFPGPKSRHPFHMHSMILGQPAYMEETDRRVRASNFWTNFRQARHLVLTGCGTSFHSALYGSRILRAALGSDVSVEAIHAYELANGLLPSGGATIVGVSHSGSTLTTNRALGRAKRSRRRTLAICGLAGSRMEDMSDETLVIGSTHDRSWANTMSYTTQMLAFAILAASLRSDWSGINRGITKMPTVLRQALTTEAPIRKLSRRVARTGRVTFLGSGWDEVTSLEAALKIRETCGVSASGYHTEQFLHGPFLSLDRRESIVVLRSLDDRTRFDSLHRGLSKSGAWIVTIGEHPMASIRLPRMHPYLRPIVSIVPLQFLAYYAAVARHANPDVMRTDIPRFRAGVEALSH